MTAETVLLVHNRYLERGGEEGAFEAEGRLLERFGHRVVRYERDNREIASMGAPELAQTTVWNPRAASEIGDLVIAEGVSVVHFHNTFPLISPAAHHAARAAGAAVVQTLHNFRLLCANGIFLRDGTPCQKCLGRPVPWPAIAHRCYRDSTAASAVVAGMQSVHRAMRTWQTQVDAFIVLSRFAESRFLIGGIPADRMFVSAVSPELPDSAPVRGDGQGGHFLYVGRLAEEKGIDVLLRAWELLPCRAELRILGDGESRGLVQTAAERDPRVRWLGAVTRDQVLQEMADAYALIFPSVCYENFPGVMVEAQAMGLPVIASELGGGGEMVADGGFGVLFEPGNPVALAAAIQRLQADPELCGALSVQARARYETTLTPDRSYARLLDVYARALARRHGPSYSDAR